MLIKLKKIFEYFSCFWKVFFYKNFHKNPNIFNSAFWRLTSESQVFQTQSQGYTEVFATLWRVRLLVVKNT